MNNNWKEQLKNHNEAWNWGFVSPNGYCFCPSENEIRNFISTEIIEKIIEDIPDYKKEMIPFPTQKAYYNLADLKQQLRDKWL